MIIRNLSVTTFYSVLQIQLCQASVRSRCKVFVTFYLCMFLNYHTMYFFFNLINISYLNNTIELIIQYQNTQFDFFMIISKR